MSILFLLLILLLSTSTFNVSFAAGSARAAAENFSNGSPFTAKAYLVRYWNNHITNKFPKPTFFLSKASPLTAVDSAVFTRLAAQKSLASHLNSFCSSANLFCLFDSEEEPDQTELNRQAKDSNFAVYGNRNFAGYGTSRLEGSDSFKNYSDGLNSPNHSFKRYSANSNSHNEDFINYAKDGNVATSNFINYGSAATGGSGEFKNYDPLVNVPNLGFTSYDLDSNSHKVTFTSYSDDANSGSQSFSNYGKKGNAVPNDFTSYAADSNIVSSTFTGYGESGNGANDSFKAYGLSANNPHNNFKSYGNGGNLAVDSFSNYRNEANVGDDTFQSYAKNSNAGKVNFAFYGRSFNHGNDTFKEYGKGSVGRTTVGFKSYSVDRTFTEYAAKEAATFAEYSNFTTTNSGSGSSVKRWVEEGKFFREAMLRPGNAMVMPDIRDKMPKRSFLPRALASKLPFSSSKISGVRKIFRAPENSMMESVIANALSECERPPSSGETKRCVGSAEDMIDFAAAVLGRDVVVRTTENVNGSKQKVMIGSVKGIKGGEVTKSVSCHQSLYPYLLYYCHSVPKVRVYEAEILELEEKKKINRGVAICHLDTSAWAPEHGAFVALGSGPGKIEVCHWIFENDMTWTRSD